MKVGLIGYGRLGKLVASNLAQDSDLLVCDPQADEKELKRIGATSATLEDICQICPIVIPVVPISALESLLQQMGPLLQEKKTLVIDVCSVKSLPIKWMKASLPTSVSILGTHPMFGPDSAAKSLFGHKIVLCPERIEDDMLSNIIGYLESHGLKVISSTAEEHDRQVASSLLLTHFIGRSLIDFGATDLSIDTKGYRRLMKILETVENDTWQLFVDMNRFNPYAKELRDKFLSSMSAVNQKVEHL